MMKREAYALVVGSLNCDTIYLLDRLPLKGESYAARSAQAAPGGKGANQAVQLARLGMKTRMIGKVGNDVFGRYLVEELRSSGVDCSCIGMGSRATGMAAAQALPDGSVRATVALGANLEITPEEIERRRALIEQAQVLLLEMEIAEPANLRAFNIAKRAGVYTVFNAAPALPVAKEMLWGADCLIVNETEAAQYLGKDGIDSPPAAMDAGREFVQESGHTLIITLGAQGSVLIHPEICRHFPADLGLAAVETTGCGDSYVGAFAYQKALGASDEEACLFASAASQLTATRIGGQPAMPTLEEVLQIRRL